MITIAEVIEQCAKVCEAYTAWGLEWQQDSNDMAAEAATNECAAAIRTLAAQYEGCIVAEGDVWLFYEDKTLYRAREAK